MVVIDPGTEQQVSRLIFLSPQSNYVGFFPTQVMRIHNTRGFSCGANQLRINFNITLLDLPCRFAVVDILDVLGTNRMNVSKNIEKVRGPPSSAGCAVARLSGSQTCAALLCLRSGTLMSSGGGGSSRAGTARRGTSPMTSTTQNSR